MNFARKIPASCLLLVTLLALTLTANVGRAHADVVACQLSVPQDALSSAGLATPWQLQAGCQENNRNQAVFVQAAIFDPATKTFSTYSPLVIDAGTAPAIPPTPPNLPAGAVVALFGGGNDDVTTLTGASSQCVNGITGRPFGQVFFCNGVNFFKAVNAAHVAIPALGRETIDGLPCPTVRDFRVVDQDQSDNVQTTYLVAPDGRIAQNTAANRGDPRAAGAVPFGNGSDNTLLTKFIDPAIKCTPWTAPDIADNGNLVPVQALDELQAAAYQQSPVALIPNGDPMVGPNNLAMVNAYRANVDQPTIHASGQANTVPYCAHLKNTFPKWVARHKAEFQGGSPSGGTLYDFLRQRFATSLILLGCK